MKKQLYALIVLCMISGSIYAMEETYPIEDYSAKKTEEPRKKLSNLTAQEELLLRRKTKGVSVPYHAAKAIGWGCGAFSLGYLTLQMLTVRPDSVGSLATWAFPFGALLVGTAEFGRRAYKNMTLALHPLQVRD